MRNTPLAAYGLTCFVAGSLLTFGAESMPLWLVILCGAVAAVAITALEALILRRPSTPDRSDTARRGSEPGA